jgi:tetratricopeptide (TPR) repeat protein
MVLRLFRRRVMIAFLSIAVLAGAGLAGWSYWSTGELLRRGEEELAAREYAKARDYLERYLSARPGNAHARLLAARAARRSKAYYDAREHLQRCRKDGGDAEAIEIEDVLIDVQRGDERPLEGLRRRALQDDEVSLAILEVLIQHDLDTYQLWRALHELNQYLVRRPDDLRALLGRAYVWERFLYFKDALEDYRKAVAAHPDNEPARLHFADTLLVVGTPAEALTQYEWLAERSPRRLEVRLGLARCQSRLGKPQEARKLLDGLLAETTDNGEVLWERGQLALDEGKPTEAETWLRGAVRILPHDRRVNYALYRCLLDLNRHPEAEAVNASVAKIDADLRRLNQVRQEVMKKPDDASLRCEGGLLFLRNGERAEGIRWLQLALRLDPACQPARKALAEDEVPPSRPGHRKNSQISQKGD